MKLITLTLLSAAAIAGTALSQDPNADNTGKNTRDRDDQSQTATDQSNELRTSISQQIFARWSSVTALFP
jgi:hypothetical protein